MDYPNKIFVVEKDVEIFVGGNYHYSILIAASDIDIAKEYIKKEIGINVEPKWVMNAGYQTIYNQTGVVKVNPQVKILFNNRCQIK